MFCIIIQIKRRICKMKTHHTIKEEFYHGDFGY
nr:MAG TPA: hypothetical protein [Bacteriophage sp.]